jgi:hypothetical protein
MLWPFSAQQMNEDAETVRAHQQLMLGTMLAGGLPADGMPMLSLQEPAKGQAKLALPHAHAGAVESWMEAGAAQSGARSAGGGVRDRKSDAAAAGANSCSSPQNGGALGGSKKSSVAGVKRSAPAGKKAGARTREERADEASKKAPLESDLSRECTEEFKSSKRFKPPTPPAGASADGQAGESGRSGGGRRRPRKHEAAGAAQDGGSVSGANAAQAALESVQPPAPLAV